MLFNSYIFIFAFLPICIIGYFLLNKFEKYETALGFLLVLSFVFYGYNNPYYLAIIVFSILINYGCYLCINKFFEKEKTRAAKAITVAGVLINLGVLIYFKYMDFFISNINSVFKSDFNLLHIALPLGISFFTFQQISFIVDTYHKETGKVGILHYATFVAFFPQLIAGPIVSHDEILPQFEDKSRKAVNLENLTRGFYLFVLGLSKKVLIANRFSSAITYCYTTIDNMNTVSAFIVMISYTIQIYFDFSGYCDMAVGIGKMLNIDIPINFNSPYKAFTIKEFWDRWHITLTRFFTKYIYIPLGGSRKGKVRTYINILIVFLASGFWHGADWKFVIWGMMHGIAMVVYRLFKKFFDRIHPAVNWLITFLYVNIAWIFFRAPSIEYARRVIKHLFSFEFAGFDATIAKTYEIAELKKVVSVLHLNNIVPYFIMNGFMVVAFWLMVAGDNAIDRTNKFKPTVIKGITTVFLLAWSVCSLAGMQEFLYFNF